MNKVPNQTNTYQAMWVGLGSLSSFAFTIVSAAILSRYLSKDEYGTYKQVMYVYNSLLIVFTLGLPKAYSYFLPKYDIKYGYSIVRKLNTMFLLIGFGFSIILYCGSSIIAEILGNDKLVSSLKLFSLTPIFILPTMGIEGIMATHKRNNINTIYVILTRIIMLVFVILPVMCYRANSESAIAGFTVSSFLVCIIGLYIKRIPYKGIISNKSDLTYYEIFRFSIPLMFASIGGIAIKFADQFFVSRFFGPEQFADFANGSTDVPFVGMVLGASATILLPEFSRCLSKYHCSYEDIIELWRRTTLKAALAIYPLIVFCIFYASDIMIFLYGNQYSSSATYFVVISIVNIFTIAPYYPIIIALGETKYYAKVHLFMAIFVWLIEYLTVCIYESVIAIAIVSALLQIIKIIIMTNFISKRFNVRLLNLFRFNRLFAILFSNIACCTIVYVLFKHLFILNNAFLVLLLSFTIYISSILLTQKMFNLDYFVIIKPIINKFTRS